MTELYLDPNIKMMQRPNSRVSLDDLREKYGLDAVYQMSQNENPLGPSPKVVEAIGKIAPTLSYYPDFSDLDLREAIAETIRRGVTSDYIYTGCSGFESLELMARGFLRAGDEVIVSSPTFTGAYNKLATLQGAQVIDVPLVGESFAYDVAGVLAAITDKTRLIMLCNPNNPTGTIMTQGELDKLMAGVPEHVLVVSDEVYHHFVQAPDFADMLPYVLNGRNVVIIHSFSKAYGLAGLRLGYGIARPELANYIGGMHRGFHQNKLALAAGVAACSDQAHLRYVIDYLNVEKAWLFEELDRLDVKYWRSETNFILFETRLPAVELNQKLLERGIIARPQDNIGMPYRMRVSLGTTEANHVFIAALEAILQGN